MIRDTGIEKEDTCASERSLRANSEGVMVGMWLGSCPWSLAFLILSTPFGASAADDPADLPKVGDTVVPRTRDFVLESDGKPIDSPRQSEYWYEVVAVDSARAGGPWLSLRHKGSLLFGWAKADSVLSQDRAKDHFDSVIDREPNDAFARLARGHLRGWKKDEEGALLDFNEAIRIEPTWATAYCARALLRLARNDKDGALADAEEAVRLEPNVAQSFVTRGRIRSNRGEKELALADLNHAISIDPNFAPAYVERGYVRESFRDANGKETKDLAGALADYDQAIRLNPRSTRARISRSFIRRDQGDLAGAIVDLSECIRIDPNDADAYRVRGQRYDDAGDLVNAMADFDRAISIDPEDAYCYSSRARVRAKQGQLDAAISDQSEAIRLQPEDAYYRYVRGNLYADRNDHEKAIDDHTEAIRLKPNESSYYFMRQWSYKKLQRLDEALADINECIRLEPERFDRVQSRAVIHIEAGRRESAADDYDLAASLCKDPVEKEKLRGQALSLRGESSFAIAALTEAIRLNPKSADLYSSRARHRSRLGRFDLALEDINKAIQLQPDNIWHYSARADYLFWSVRLSDALSDINRVLNDEHNVRGQVRAEVYKLRGQIHLARWAPLDALADFDRAIALDDKSPDLFFLRAWTCFALKRTVNQYELKRVMALTKWEGTLPIRAAILGYLAAKQEHSDGIAGMWLAEASIRGEPGHQLLEVVRMLNGEDLAKENEPSAPGDYLLTIYSHTYLVLDALVRFGPDAAKSPLEYARDHGLKTSPEWAVVCLELKRIQESKQTTESP
jgi:tetratricopeptide (TPR) repeat protein